MLERVVDQLADHTVEDHLHVRVVALGSQVGGEADLRLVHRRTARHEVLHAARQAEIVEHVGREVVRNLAQRADRLVDHVGCVVDQLALRVVVLLAREGRQRHLGRREQRSQAVVQLLREARPRLLLGAQHGREDALVEELTLAVEPPDVLEEFVRIHHPHREAERHHHARVGERDARHAVAVNQHELHHAFDRQEQKTRDEKNPHRVVFGGVHQAQGVDRSHGLHRDGDDEQNFDPHRS